MPKSRKKWWIAGFFLCVALGIVALILSNGRPPIRVQVVNPKHGRVESIVTANSVGTVEADLTSTVSAEISGRVRTIAVRPGAKEGSAVTADTVVVEIDDTDIVAEWTVTNSDIETQRKRLTQSKLRVDKLIADRDRLIGTDEPQQNIDRLNKEIEIARMDEQIAEASIRTLQAQLQVIELRKAKTKVRSPFHGTVSKLLVEVGELVTPGKPLYQILKEGPLLIRAPIDEVDKPRIRLDMPVRVTFDGYKERFDGTIVEIMEIASTDQKNNRTIDIKAKLDKMPREICAGMSAHLEVIIEHKDGGLFLPTHLVHEERGDSGGKFVWVIERNIARKRVVKTGLMNWETIEILEGVSEKDAVLNPLNLAEDQTIVEGAKVEVVP